MALHVGGSAVLLLVGIEMSAVTFGISRGAITELVNVEAVLTGLESGKLADDLHVPLLGSIPLDPALREAGDAGEPLVSTNPNAPSAAEIAKVADAVVDLRREQGVGFVKALPVLS